jgi:LL-diaminopimelate aminotransferase
MRRAHRISTVPPYLFAAIDKKRREAEARGVDIINLGIGDPDQPTPAHIIESLCVEAHRPANHRYPEYEGSRAFREAAAGYYQRRFGVELDPRSEVMALIGSKEGIAHIIWAYVDPGDVVLIPDPAYPVYRVHTLLAGGTPVSMPLTAETGFLPDFAAIDPAVADRAKIMFLNYPNNPTSAVADASLFERAVAFCRRHDILLCHDNAYAEMTFEGFVAPSVLRVEGAREVAVEFYSLSKPFNMTGWRIAFLAGNADAVAALGIIKTNTDSGQFTAIQTAAATGLCSHPEGVFARMNDMYQKRRDVFIGGLNRLGWRIEPPRGTFYVWFCVPAGYTSAGFATDLLERAGIIVTPGGAYGACGEGYVRAALTVDETRLREAVDRLSRMLEAGV